MAGGKKIEVIVIGAGPAGLAAAYELTKLDKDKKYKITILEKDTQVGGLAKTLKFKGYRFDLGGHRFYTKFPEIDKFYKTFLGKEMLKRDRLSRIYYQRKFYNYPLSATNALKNLGLMKAEKIFLSWLKRQFHRYKNEQTFDEWVSNRFGDELFKIFFKSYTEKVWGIKTSKLSADWASQRIQNFNLLRAVFEAIFKIHSGSKTTITKFYYPKLGPGMLYESLKEKILKKGVNVIFGREVEGFEIKNKKIQALIVKKAGKTEKITADIVISTLPFNKLVLYLKPDFRLKKQIKNLRFRNFITVNLIIKSNPFPDQWIYIHEPEVKVGRIQNFRNWSPYMKNPTGDNTPIGMEYFCGEGDFLWNLSDKQLLTLAKKELREIGLIKDETEVIEGFVYKVENAYPIYDVDYQTPYISSRKFIEEFDNLYLCGRGGLFRYNNQDHSILTGFYVARNIVAGINKYNVWDVGGDDYLEDKK
jgi:protoporphyrinogen oxidase